MRKQFDFIITGTPFCGYYATVKALKELGISCSVEKGINDWWAMLDVETENRIEGDCSWFAAPYLDYFNNSTIILHQTINPSKFIEEAEQSNLFKNWETDYLHSHKTDFSANKFIKYQGREWGWPNDTKGRIEMFYLKWNLLIEAKSQGKKYMRYQVEEFGNDLLERICWFIGANFTENNTPKSINKKYIESNKQFSFNQELKDLCFRYDYLPLFESKIPFK